MARVRVVLLGLSPDSPKVPEAFRPTLTKMLDDLYPQFAQAGMDYEFFTVIPEEGVATLGQKLESYRPDCVIIGNGIRREANYTHFMEQLIDLVRTSAPQAKLGFNTLPDDTIDAVRRWFPNPQKSA